MEDPFYRDNEFDALEVSKFDYEYKREFTVEKDMLEHDVVLIRFEGLDTLCEVFLNGTSILKADNMHRTYEVDVKNVLVSGQNEIHVVIQSATLYALERRRNFICPAVPMQCRVSRISVKLTVCSAGTGVRKSLTQESGEMSISAAMIWDESMTCI